MEKNSVDMDKMVLNNLRRQINRVAEIVLGEGFYNYTHDTLSADREMCEDIIEEHKRVERENVWLLICCWVLMLVCTGLIGYIRWH